MTKQEDKYRDTAFVIVDERSCPIYEAGEELKVQNFNLMISCYKPSCLHLADKIADIVTIKENGSDAHLKAGLKSQFECGGGCGEGMITFEYKKEKDFATLQMKMLKEAKNQQNRQRIEQYFSELRNLDIFKPLSDRSLTDLALMLDFKTIPRDKRVVKKGSPGSNLYLILQGAVAVIDDARAKVAELKAGEIFGEMSLLSGEPILYSIHTTEETRVATLSAKDFKEILRNYHALQFFLLKLLVERSQSIALRSGHITSGMTGKLAEIPPESLFTMIRSAQKTGTLQLSLPEGKATVFFNEGQIVYARFQKYRQQEAMQKLLQATSGHFSYVRGIPRELEKTPPIKEFLITPISQQERS